MPGRSTARTVGVVETFLGSQREYLYVDDRVCWHMGDPSSPDPEQQPGLINRSWTDVAKYRDEATKLGYEGEALEKLVVRWQELLQRAKGTVR
ncbi:MAG TPA: hypothetical protein VFM36_06180 [Thermoanaerobaculia bacterium]|nr:hypothetical protein [Thermoanaerobaculia bacterium]